MTLYKNSNDNIDDRVTDHSSQFNKSLATEPLQTEDAYLTENVAPVNNSKVMKNRLIANQVDIYKFIHPGKYLKSSLAVVSSCDNQRDENSSILESAFSSVIGTKVIVDSEQQKTSTIHHESLPESLVDFHSEEDIKQIHEQSIRARADAFYQLTQLENNVSTGQTQSSKYFADIDLSQEFSRIKENEKVDVFIEEFEQLIANLNTQKPIMEIKSDNIDFIVQFKTSIHMIKLLSGMMQADHLNHFSKTVIDFLDDLLEGKSSLTDNIIKRLSVVVNFYDYYNNAIQRRHRI